MSCLLILSPFVERQVDEAALKDGGIQSAAFESEAA